MTSNCFTITTALTLKPLIEVSLLWFPRSRSTAHKGSSHFYARISILCSNVRVSHHMEAMDCALYNCWVCFIKCSILRSQQLCLSLPVAIRPELTSCATQRFLKFYFYYYYYINCCCCCLGFITLANRDTKTVTCEYYNKTSPMEYK